MGATAPLHGDPLTVPQTLNVARASGSRARPAARGCLVVGLFVVSIGHHRSARAEGGPLVLDRATVSALSARSPSVAIAEARVGEARALRVGAGALASTNPDVAVFGGPRHMAGGDRSTDIVVSLAWPVDVSGTPSVRRQSADEAGRVAEAAALDARRIAVAEALSLWIRAHGAALRVELEQERSRLDDELVRIARVRRGAGVAGDQELALASVIAAEGRARLGEARADAEATTLLLRGRLGLPADRRVALAGELTDTELPSSLAELLARLPDRGDLMRAQRAVPAARAESTRESRAGLPVPRVMAGAGRESESFAHVGLDVPLPIYQRNQTNRAVAEARVATAEIEEQSARGMADAELRAAHARYLGARGAWQVRAAALPSVDDVEKLALRAYELGSMPLASVVVSRREAVAARAAHLDALVATARARVDLETAAGLSP